MNDLLSTPTRLADGCGMSGIPTALNSKQINPKKVHPPFLLFIKGLGIYEIHVSIKDYS